MNFGFIQVPLFAELADKEFWQSFFEVTHLQCKRARFAILTNSGVDYDPPLESMAFLGEIDQSQIYI